jgi:tetratricopeptide (TPR) repeat protein
LPADRQSVDLYQLIGDELNAARMQVNLATLWYEEGRVAEALAASEQVEQELSRLGDQPWLARVVNNTGVYLQALGRPAEAYVAYHRAARLYTQSRERPYACSALINCVDALLDEGKRVEASAVMGQVDGMLKELDPPPEWLLREVDVQVTRLAALSPQETE